MRVKFEVCIHMNYVWQEYGKDQSKAEAVFIMAAVPMLIYVLHKYSNIQEG